MLRRTLKSGQLPHSGFKEVSFCQFFKSLFYFEVCLRSLRLRFENEITVLYFQTNWNIFLVPVHLKTN